jgi:hypothetical protein
MLTRALVLVLLAAPALAGEYRIPVSIDDAVCAYARGKAQSKAATCEAYLTELMAAWAKEVTGAFVGEAMNDPKRQSKILEAAKGEKR